MKSFRESLLGLAQSFFSVLALRDVLAGANRSYRCSILVIVMSITFMNDLCAANLRERPVENCVWLVAGDRCCKSQVNRSPVVRVNTLQAGLVRRAVSRWVHFKYPLRLVRPCEYVV